MSTLLIEWYFDDFVLIFYASGLLSMKAAGSVFLYEVYSYNSVAERSLSAAKENTDSGIALSLSFYHPNCQ